MLNITSVDYPSFGDMNPRDLSHITDLIIHHTAGPIAQTALEIDAEHRVIGDACIAYNWVITQDGLICNGRPADVHSAATFGRNAQSVSVVLTGNFQSDDKGYTGPPTPAQVESLKQLALYAHTTFPTIERTIGHRDVAPMFYPNDQGDYSTACPGNDLYNLIPDIKNYVMLNNYGKK